MIKHKIISKSVGAALGMTALLLALSACDQQKGPAEQAGEKIDNAAEQAGQQIEKAGDAVQDAAKGDKN